MKNTTWRLIKDGHGDGRLNMAVDRAILTACDRGQAPATLRLYGWDRPTLSIGYSQNEVKDVDTKQCERRNIPVVRRFTGGRALLHQYEFTYSFVGPVPHPGFPGNLSGDFCAISKAVILSLKKAGVENPEMVGKEKRDSARGRNLSPACFSASNHGEIRVNGKKLAGSAQRRLNGAFLQHGSILIDKDIELAHSLLRYSSETEKNKVFQDFVSNTLTLRELLPTKIEWEKLCQCFADGFQESFPGLWELDLLNSSEEVLVERYLKESQ